MRLGIVAGSFKPYHAGHHKMVEIAAENNDQVYLFVSTTDRLRKGEHPLYGKDMRKVWNAHLNGILPNNVHLYLLGPGQAPIRSVYELLEDASKKGMDDHFTIYSDPVDMGRNYRETALVKSVGQDFAYEQIDKVALDRNETVPVSGTDMRRHLADGNEEAFKDMLPFQLSDASKQEIFDILSGKALQESLLRAFIRTAID